ncbi:MAG TPA: hypothetical protein VGB76_00840, partial [Pyrinomonadaceae bacterium]
MNSASLRAVLSRLTLAAVLALLASPPAVSQKNCGKEKNPYTGMIISINPSHPAGKLKIRLNGRAAPFNAEPWMTVRRGALLELAEGASATIMCGDQSQHSLKSGANPVPCSDKSFVNRNGGCIAPARGGDNFDGSFPVIVAPRRTLLLTRRPTFRWTPVSKSAAHAAASDPEITYTVSLFGAGMELIWLEKTSANVLPYPANRPELKAGDYQLVVVAGNFGSSEKERMPDTGFTVLEDCQPQASRAAACKAREVRAEVNAIRRLRLPPDAEKLMLAYVYMDRELYAEAIESLNAIVAPKSLPVVRLLGDLYLLTGLNREAERSYLDALSLPRMADEPEDKALSLSALAEIYEARGARSDAGARWDEAIKVYER